MGPTTTVAILRETAVGIGITPKLVTDSGVENINGEVDGLVEAGVITRILALVEVSYSNSIIAAYWRSLKHEWLFLNSLDNLPTLEKLVAFHVLCRVAAERVAAAREGGMYRHNQRPSRKARRVSEARKRCDDEALTGAVRASARSFFERSASFDKWPDFEG